MLRSTETNTTAPVISTWGSCQQQRERLLEEVNMMSRNARDITLAYAIIVVVGCVDAAVCGAGGCKEEEDIDAVLRLQSNDTKVEWSQATTVEAVEMHSSLLSLSNVVTPRHSLRQQQQQQRRRRRQQVMGGFRIRLHWEKGYNWQNTSTEKYWCMECKGNACISGTIIQINKCSSSSTTQKFIAISKTIRPVSNPNLCFTITGYDGKDTPIKLRTCNNNGNSGSSSSSTSIQNFIQLQSTTKFELHPQEQQKYCLSQHHHPKAKEVIYPENCEKTRATDTTYWRVY